MRKLLLSALLLFGFGCSTASSPYIRVSDEERNAVSTFRYGNFCGAYHPRFPNENPKERIEYLYQLEPMDDVDKSCRLHDHCYELEGHDSPICDYAFTATLSNLLNTGGAGQEAGLGFEQYRFECWSLVADITDAMGFKRHPNIIRVLFGPMVAAGHVLGQPMRSGGYPPEGGCNSSLQANWQAEFWEYVYRATCLQQHPSARAYSDFLSQNPSCATPPFDLAESLPTREERLQLIADWAFVYCIHRPTRSMRSQARILAECTPYITRIDLNRWRLNRTLRAYYRDEGSLFAISRVRLNFQ